MRKIAAVLLFPFRALWRALWGVSSALLVIMVVGLFTLNVATLTVQGIFSGLSSVIELLDPDLSVRSRTERQIAQVEGELAAARQRLGDLEANLHAANADKHRIEAELIRTRGTATNLQGELDALNERARQLQSDVDALRIREGQLNAQWELATQERDSARAEREQARRQWQRGLAERDLALAERDLAVNEKDALQIRLTQTDEAAQAARVRIDRLTRRIAVRGAEVASANISSMPLEAVPYIGVAVIVGSTALELSSACDTANDMAEIRVAMGLGADGDEVGGTTVCGMTVPTAEELWTTLTSDEEDLIARACNKARDQGQPLPESCEERPRRPDEDTLSESAEQQPIEPPARK